MKNLKRLDMVKQFTHRKGSFFVTLYAITSESDMRAKMDGVKNPYWKDHKEGRLVKKSITKGTLNWHYGNSVNNQRHREDKPLNSDGSIEHFTPLPRKWGERVIRKVLVNGKIKEYLTPFVRHKGKVYLELKAEENLYSEFFLNGEHVERDKIAPFIAEKKESSRQGVDKLVICRDYNIWNVTHLQFDKELHKLTA